MRPALLLFGPLLLGLLALSACDRQALDEALPPDASEDPILAPGTYRATLGVDLTRPPFAALEGPAVFETLLRRDGTAFFAVRMAFVADVIVVPNPPVRDTTYLDLVLRQPGLPALGPHPLGLAEAGGFTLTYATGPVLGERYRATSGTVHMDVSNAGAVQGTFTGFVVPDGPQTGPIPLEGRFRARPGDTGIDPQTLAPLL